ncbi:protein-glutamine gamma-glutamyltransferase [Cytobacillus sp. Hm23]
MIIINDKLIDPIDLDINYFYSSQQEIINKMAYYPERYVYDNIKQFHFEIYVRTKTVEAAKDLLYSGAKFATFANSKCNEEYWHLTDMGAFDLKEGIKSSTGIRDIFINGKKYAFECATAMVIIFYKALLESIEENDFNRLFANLTLYDWHYDKDLGLITKAGNDFLPGDCIYFNNPDYNPATPEWQGENAIVLEDDLYFGHGIGIKTAEEMIEALNKRRRIGSLESAYLLSQTSRPNYKALSVYRKEIRLSHSINSFKMIIANIGNKNYIL